MGRYLILAGRPIATNECENYLKRYLCHFVIKSEGENKVGFLFDNILGTEFTMAPVHGIYFRFNDRIEEIVSGSDVFNIPKETVPSREQIR